MTKNELKMKLEAGAFLIDLFDLTYGQECLIYKGNFEISDQIIYIPDVDLNEIDTESVLDDEEIENVLDNCYTGNDFMTECNGHEDLARELFDFVDWQHPNIQDVLACYDEEEFKEKYGSRWKNYRDLKQEFLWKNGVYMMKRDLVDELYKIAYKRYREKYPNKDFASIPNFLDSLWFSIEGELNRNGYDAARKYVEEAELIVLK